MKSVHGEIGNRIRLYRKRLGLSQETLALNAGLTVSFIGDIERGNKKPTVESLEKLLRALNVSFVEFFDYENELNGTENLTAMEKLRQLLSDRSNEEVEMLYIVVKRIVEYGDVRSSNRTP